MGNATSAGVTLNDYQLPTYTTAPVAQRQDQDQFEDRVEAMFRSHLAQVQQRYAGMYPASTDAQVDWALEAPISALPSALAEATVECFRGATLTDLAQLFGVPLNAQLLPDSRSLNVVRRNVAALHPDHRRARSADLYGPATVALEQLGQLIMRQADMFEGLTERDTMYHLDDRALPASLLPPPPPAPDDAAARMDDGEEDDRAAASEASPPPPITPEEREAIRSVMRPVWGEHYFPSEEELQALKSQMRAGALSLRPDAAAAEVGYALPNYDEEARARALALYTPAELAASGFTQTVGQGAITSSALILPPKPVQPRFFQGNRIADRALVFAGDTARGGTVAFDGGGLTVGGGGGCGPLVGTPLSVAYRPRAAFDLTDVVPLRPEEGNDDVTDKFEQTLAYYHQPLALCQTRLMPTTIIGSAHNEARGDLAAARGRGITSLRPGGGKRCTKTTAADMGGNDDHEMMMMRAEDVDEEEEEDDAPLRDGQKRRTRD